MTQKVLTSDTEKVHRHGWKKWNYIVKQNLADWRQGFLYIILCAYEIAIQFIKLKYLLGASAFAPPNDVIKRAQSQVVLAIAWILIGLFIFLCWMSVDKQATMTTIAFEGNSEK